MVIPRRTPSRAALALGAGAGIALLLAAPVSASALTVAGSEVSPSPSPSGYAPPEVPTLTAEIFQPLCDGDVPYLQYRVVATGTDNTTVTLTWINPSGADVVYADLPLEGRVLWPGAEVDAAGNPVDWPGWRFENGEWVEGDEFDWVRPSVDVRMEVNPELTLTADYPPSSPNCATNPPGNPDPDPSDPADPETPPGLAVTGSDVAKLGAVAAGLIAVGGIAVVVTRRRKA